MYQKTHDKIIKLFTDNHGYMSFEALKEEGVTVLQMRELEDELVLTRFARGWYWCNDCGYEKPKDYKYIEISLVDPEAVICLDSACFLGNVKICEPEVVKFAVPRTDRKKYRFDFATLRYFYTHMEEEYIKTVRTEFGSYRYFAPARAVVDLLKNSDKIDEGSRDIITAYSNSHRLQIEEYRRFIADIKHNERTKKQR